MLLSAFLVAIVMYVAKFTDWIGQIGVRPIWICPLVGLVLGDLQAGIILGASLELVFIGAISIGGSVPQDFVSGGILGCAFAILLGKEADIAVTLAVPISLAFTVIFQAETIVWTASVPLFDKFIEERNFKNYSKLHYLISFVHPLPYSIVTFLAIAFGTSGIESFINSMPAWVMSGFGIAAGILSAIGFAMLIKMLWDKSIVCFFFLGFFAVKYITSFMNYFLTAIQGCKGGETTAAFSASSLTMPMAILAICIAVFYFFNDSKHRDEMKNVNSTAKVENSNDKEGFFDE